MEKQRRQHPIRNLPQAIGIKLATDLKLQTTDNQNQIILYQDDNDITRVSVRFADEDLWLTQNQLAEIYCTTQQNISMHIRNIYADNELDANRTYKDFLLVRQEGNRQVQRNIAHYNLDMIIALGYRVRTQSTIS